MEDSEHRVKTIILFCPQMQPVAFIWARTKDHPELTPIVLIQILDFYLFLKQA
jgi:hypothetical protein